MSLLRSSDSKGEAPLQWRFPLTIQKPRKQSQALQTVVQEPCGQVFGNRKCLAGELVYAFSSAKASQTPVPIHQITCTGLRVCEPRPKTQERERGDRRMAREEDRRRRYRKNFKIQRGRLSACGRHARKLRSETSIIAPTVIEDYGSPHPRLFT
ncbi:hypothetical protein EDD85DRAFT_439527 [Armillaria nabsnona]|nr:hypothetical protein EDD85DRAFT_439527 [Armillaria nabsnona]